MRPRKTAVMSEIAIFASLAMLLDLTTQPLSLGPWISFSFKMLPIFILAFRRGIRPAMLAGFIWGLLQVALGQATGNWLNFFQGLLEYFVAFSLIGLAGWVKPWLKSAIQANKNIKALGLMFLGLLTGSLARYLIHFVAGLIFWANYAPKGQSALAYSLIINASSFLGEVLASSIALVLLYPFLKRLWRL